MNSKIKELLKRKHAVSRLFMKVNQIVREINDCKIGSIKKFLDEFGQWLRHKIRCIMIKQWKKPKTIQRNLMKINNVCQFRFREEDIYKCDNTRLG